MRTPLLAVLLLPLLLLTGCGIDKSRVEAELAQAERTAQNLAAFVAATQPQAEALAALAASADNPTAAAAAAKVLEALRVAQEALPKVNATIEATRTQLATLETDAAGKVPWWSILGSLVLIVPRVLGGGPMAEAIANGLWSLFATKRQKAADNPLPTTAQA